MSRRHQGAAAKLFRHRSLAFDPLHGFVLTIVAHELHEVSSFGECGGGKVHRVGCRERKIEEARATQIEHCGRAVSGKCAAECGGFSAGCAVDAQHRLLDERAVGNPGIEFSQAREAEGVVHHFVGGHLVFVQSQSGTAATATDTLLEEVEVRGVELRGREFPVVFHVDEVVIVVGKYGEFNLSFGGNVHTVAFCVDQTEVAEPHAVTAGLRAGVVREITVHALHIAAEERTFAAVGIVFARAACRIIHEGIAAVEAHAHTEAAKLTLVLRLCGIERHVEHHITVGVDGIGERGGHEALARCGHRVGAAAVGRLDCGHCILIVAVHNAIAPFKRVVGLAGIGGFVLDPAEVVGNGTLAVGDNGEVVVLPVDELRSGRVESHRNHIVGDRGEATGLLQLEGGRIGLGRKGGQGGALGEFELLGSENIAGFCPVLGCFQTEIDVEVVVVGTVFRHLRGHAERKGAECCSCKGGEFDITLFYADTVLQYFEIEGEVGEISEGVVVTNDQTLVVLAVVETEGDVLVHLLDDVEFGCPLTFGSDHTVVDEVTLVRTGVVVTGGQLFDALLEFLGIVDALIDPVPNATADAEFRLLDDVPVFAEITHAVAHGVVVFAHEEGLAGGVVVGILLHVAHIGVHF